MDIYSDPGTKVIFYYPNAGYKSHQEIARKNLKVGRVYTVKKMYVENWSSKVSLDEVPGIVFNSVLFENQSECPNYPEFFLWILITLKSRWSKCIERLRYGH